MLGFALARLLRDGRRTLATLLAVALAVTSFVVLTGTAQTQRLTVIDTLEENFRGAYDILVRPSGTTNALERETGQVRASFLSGTYGGITLDQVAQIQQIGGIEAAAPVVMVGTTMQNAWTHVDVTDALDQAGAADRERFMIRYHTRVQSRNGQIDLPEARGYLYVTRAPFRSEEFEEKTDSGTMGGTRSVEVIDGADVHPCTVWPEHREDLPQHERWQQGCMSIATGNSENTGPLQGQGPGRVGVLVSMQFPVTVAAIDPEQEARLVGLNEAIVAGRALNADDSWSDGFVPGTGAEGSHFFPPHAPAILASSLKADYAFATQVDLLPEGVTDTFLTLTRARAGDPALAVASATADHSLPTVTTPASEVFAGYLAQQPPRELNNDTLRDWGSSTWLTSVLKPGEVTYSTTDPLRPETVPNPDGERLVANGAPRTSADTAFRPLNVIATDGGLSGESGCRECWSGVILGVVGHYDPAQLRQGGDLGRVPLEEYTRSRVEAADDATRAALGTDELLPYLNPGEYLQAPPTVLMPIAALPLLNATRLKAVDADAPVSAVRIRVAGVTGMDPTSRERIRLVAQQVVERTGLEVDIVVGSSQLARRVELPATEMGVPALNLNELWSKKGVAVAISEALDTKSLLLFGLILVSSALTVSLTAHASVQARRRELGVLACVGWRPGRLRREALLELVLIGLGAGVMGALGAWPLASALGVEFDPARAGWAIPIAVLLTVLAGLAATRAAGRIDPIAALCPPVVAPRRAPRPVHSAVGLGVRQLVRRPLRLVSGAIAVALATASLTLLGSIQYAFSGSVVGTFLGDVVALQVRAPDLIAAAFLALLGIVAVVTVLFLGLIEDARSYAALSAVGWRDGRLATAIAAQGGLLGLVGGLLGVVIGLGLVLGLIGSLVPTTLAVAGVVALAAIALCLVAALLPAAALRRQQTARVLTLE